MSKKKRKNRSSQRQEDNKGKSNMDTGVGAMQNFQKEFSKNQPMLTMSRVPEPTLQMFKELAFAEFAGDYGLTLKAILDYYINDIKHQDAIIRLVNLERKVDMLCAETGVDQSSQAIAKTLDGKVLKKSKKEKKNEKE